MKEFEPIILKKLIYNGEFFGKSMPILRKKYFSGVGNQELFNLIQEYYKEYHSIPTTTELITKVKNVSNAEIRKEIISSLQEVNKTEEVQNVKFMLDETLSWVKDAMYLESLQIGSDGLMKKDDDLKRKAKKIMEDMSKLSIDTDLGLDFDDVNAMIQYYSERMLGIKTQHKMMNDRLGPGFIPGTLSVILAASGVGKSLLMTDLVSGMIQDNKNILLVSLEMSDKEVMKRVHANALDLPINQFTDLSKTEGELKALGREFLSKDQIIGAYNKLKTTGKAGKLFVKDYPNGHFSALMLEQLIESYKIEKGVEFDIIFIDYLGIMKSDLLSPGAGLYSYVKSIAEEVRASAKKLNIPIISASQLNRGVYKQESKDVDNSSVSDSMGTVMTADFMMFLLQNEEMKTRCEMVCKITKNRFSGITDTWMMNIDYTKMRFHDMLVQEIQDLSFIDSPSNKKEMDDFGIVTVKKQEQAEKYAKDEIREIVKEDFETVKRVDNAFKDDIEDLYKELGI